MEQPKTVFATHRIYTKTSRFDAPLTPTIFKENNLQPQMDMQVNTQFIELEPNIYETILSLDIVNKAQDKVLWEINLKQAGIFKVEGLPKDQLELALHGYCMNILYPYACETASNIAVKGGFLPIYLTPINFEALYREQLRKQAEAAG